MSLQFQARLDSADKEKICEIKTRKMKIRRSKIFE